MSQVFSLDAETHSPVDLRAHGADVYSRHPATRCLMLAFHPVGQPEKPQLWLEGDPVPDAIVGHIHSGGLFAGWNVLFFDRLVYSRILVRDHGFPAISADAWRDSMHLAAHANLPRSLEGAGGAVGISFEASLKDSNRIRRITDAKRNPLPAATVREILDNPANYSNKLVDDLQWLAARCVQDVEMEEQVLLRLPPWPDIEPWVKMPHIDRKINDRGIKMDVPLVEGLAKAAAIETARLDVEMAKVTDGAVPKTTNVESLKEWLVANGVELPDARTSSDEEDEDETDRKSPWRLRKSDMADILARSDIPDKCRLAVAMRAEAAKASARKLKTMLACAGPDGRLYGMKILMGAQSTGRWSSGRAQLDNFVRDAFGNPDEVAEANNLNPKTDWIRVKQLAEQTVETACDAGRSGDPDLLRLLYEAPRKDLQGRITLQGVLPWISRMSRRTLCAPAGQVLLNGDFANIEARIPVWLAGQEDVVEQFARGEDVYRLQAAPVYGIAPEALNKEQRQIGKVMTLFLGFGGGVNAFIPAAMNYGVTVGREDGAAIVRVFREKNATLVDFWHALLQAARWAVEYPGHEFHVPPKGLISFRLDGNCLMCRLPSGRYLRYWSPRIEQGYWDDGTPKSVPDLTVLAVKGKAVFRRTLWYGLATENVTQAIAADMLAVALENMDRAGIPVVLHVHDSIAAEQQEDCAEVLLPRFKAAMLDMPAWTQGLPVACSTDYGRRFG